MDDRLNHYINSRTNSPPFVAERHIVERLERRKKKRVVILLSVATLLWTAALYTIAFAIGSVHQTLGIWLLAAISVGYICAGCFAGIVIEVRKVVF